MHWGSFRVLSGCGIIWLTFKDHSKSLQERTVGLLMRLLYRYRRKRFRRIFNTGAWQLIGSFIPVVLLHNQAILCHLSHSIHYFPPLYFFLKVSVCDACIPSFCQPPMSFEIWLKIHTSKKPSLTGFILHQSCLCLMHILDNITHSACLLSFLLMESSSSSQQLVSCSNPRATMTEKDQMVKTPGLDIRVPGP